jgi:hypothetical protein
MQLSDNILLRSAHRMPCFDAPVTQTSPKPDRLGFEAKLHEFAQTAKVRDSNDHLSTETRVCTVSFASTQSHHKDTESELLS